MLAKLTIAVEDAVTAVEDESKAVTIIDDAPRTAKTILEEADLNKDGVLDLTEASEYLVFDGKLHIEVKIDLVFVVVSLNTGKMWPAKAFKMALKRFQNSPQKISKWPARPKIMCMETLE
jgi:hypothetical protein